MSQLVDAKHTIVALLVIAGVTACDTTGVGSPPERLPASTTETTAAAWISELDSPDRALWFNLDPATATSRSAFRSGLVRGLERSRRRSLNAGGSMFEEEGGTGIGEGGDEGAEPARGGNVPSILKRNVKAFTEGPTGSPNVLWAEIAVSMTQNTLPAAWNLPRQAGYADPNAKYALFEWTLQIAVDTTRDTTTVSTTGTHGGSYVSNYALNPHRDYTPVNSSGRDYYAAPSPAPPQPPPPPPPPPPGGGTGGGEGGGGTVQFPTGSTWCWFVYLPWTGWTNTGSCFQV